MTALHAVVDIGKTHTRINFVDSSMAVRYCASISSVLTTDCYPCYPVDKMYAWLLTELKKVASLNRLESIVVITHGAAIALTDGHDLILPVMDYEFDGPLSLSLEYDRLADDFMQTGSPRLPAGLNLGRQLYWQQQVFSEQFNRATCWLLYPQYWAWRLSGVASAELTSLGCHTDLWNSREQEFSDFALSQKWDKYFPPLKKAWAELGTVSPAVVKQTGLSADCTVFCGMHDSNASFMLQRTALKQDFVLLSTGTWLVGMCSNDKIGPLREDLDMLYMTSVWGKAIPAFRFAAGKEYAQICGTDGLLAQAEMGDIDRLIEDEIYAYPAFSPLGGPFSGRCGYFSERPEQAHLRAALASLYCALMTEYCLDISGFVGDLVIEGPFAENALYCHLLASLMPARNILIAPYENSIACAGVLLCTQAQVTLSEHHYSPVPAQKIAGLQDYQYAWRTGLKQTAEADQDECQ